MATHRKVGPCWTNETATEAPPAPAPAPSLPRPCPPSRARGPLSCPRPLREAHAAYAAHAAPLGAERRAAGGSLGLRVRGARMAALQRERAVTS